MKNDRGLAFDDLCDLADPLSLHGLPGGAVEVWDELVMQAMGIAVVVYETHPPR